MKTVSIVVKVLFSLLILFGVANYFFNYEMVEAMFINLGMPSEMIYPLGMVKLLGIVGIWQTKVPKLQTLAYIGFFINLTLAVSAHLTARDGGFYGAAIALTLALASFFLGRKANK